MRNIVHDNRIQVALQSEMLSSFDSIDDDFKDQLRTVIGANKQTSAQNSVAIALNRL
jgi:hypothetical protein